LRGRRLSPHVIAHAKKEVSGRVGLSYTYHTISDRPNIFANKGKNVPKRPNTSSFPEHLLLKQSHRTSGRPLSNILPFYLADINTVPRIKHQVDQNSQNMNERKHWYSSYIQTTHPLSKAVPRPKSNKKIQYARKEVRYTKKCVNDEGTWWVPERPRLLVRTVYNNGRRVAI
jgi:hypothetical protein